MAYQELDKENLDSRWGGSQLPDKYAAPKAMRKRARVASIKPSPAQLDHCGAHERRRNEACKQMTISAATRATARPGHSVSPRSTSPSLSACGMQGSCRRSRRCQSQKLRGHMLERGLKVSCHRPERSRQGRSLLRRAHPAASIRVHAVRRPTTRRPSRVVRWVRALGEWRAPARW